MSMKINQDQIVPSRWQRIIFDCRRGQGHLFSYLMNRFRWHGYPRMRYTGRLPDHVDVEISSVCNMQCPMCYTTTEEYKKKVKRTLMDLELFKKIIDQCAQEKVFSIRLSLRGEAFIHPNIVEMIGYAKQKGICEVSTLTNNLALTPEKFEEVMKAGLDWLTISFDGTGETYEQIRKPAIFTESYKKIMDYKKIKERNHSVKPVIRIQSVWPAIEKDPEGFIELFKPYVDEIVSNPLVDYLHKDSEIEYESDFECPVLYQRMVIGADGIVLLCSNDEMCDYPIGDTNLESLTNIWQGKKLRKARMYHRQHRGVQKMVPCRHCYLPRKTETHIVNTGQRKLNVEKLKGRTDEIGK